jgi:flavorubredoxin
MKKSIHEIEPGIFRLSVAPTDRFEYNHFLIVDQKSILIHTGGKKIFSELCPLVETLIDLKNLDFIAFSHFESDECGALNEWLNLAPNAVPLVSSLGKATMDDFSERDSEIVENGQIIDLGKHKIQVLSTPHIPHGWEACLFFEITSGILFSSDLGAQPGINPPVTDLDQTIQVLKFQKELGFMPSGENLRIVLARLMKMEIRYLATMHGSTLKGSQIKTLFEMLYT